MSDLFGMDEHGNVSYNGARHVGGSDTLSDAKEELMGNLDEGTTCPCCGQFAKRYRRKLHSAMAAGLRRALKLYGLAPFEIDAGLGRQYSSDFAKLRFWGLIDQLSDTGKWHVTLWGRLFVTGGIVRKYVHIYNNSADFFSGDDVTIREALGSKFDCDEL